MIEFVITPTTIWLEQRLDECCERFLVASPYVGDYLVKVGRNLPKDVSRTLVTRTDLRDFAKGASDIDAVCNAAKLGSKVLSLPRLHAKVYIIDKSAALVTSANATHSGMRRNYECGVAIDSEQEVSRLASLLLNGFGAREKPQQWTLTQLETLRGPIQVMREALPPLTPVSKTELEEHPKIVFSQQKWRNFTAGLPGWAQFTLEGVIQQPDDIFRLHDIYRTCLPLTRERFPANRHPKDKLRQQLQLLRDLGMIEFLGDGKYRKTVGLQQ